MRGWNRVAQPGISAALVRLSFLVQRRYARVCAGHDLSPAQAQLMCVIKDRRAA